MAIITEQEAGPNVRAYLDMLAHAEGTAGRGDDGYNVIVGGELFSGYNDHPRRLVDLPRLGIKSTAAGRYQFLARTWDSLVIQCKLTDFGPLSQDRAAIRMIRWVSALDDIRAGRVGVAIGKCRKLWASLPGAGYGQRELRTAELIDIYQTRGGAVV